MSRSGRRAVPLSSRPVWRAASDDNAMQTDSTGASEVGRRLHGSGNDSSQRARQEGRVRSNATPYLEAWDVQAGPTFSRSRTHQPRLGGYDGGRVSQA